MKWIAYITVALIALLVTLVVGSWIVSAIMPDAGINSMLSGEGIRWFVGHLADILASHILVWLILSATALGVIKESNILNAVTAVAKRQHMEFYQRLGVHVAAIVAGMSLAIMTYLVAAPNAVLLGATGRLLPSAFAAGFVPLVCFFLTAVSGTYGFISGSFPSVKSFYSAMCHGITRLSPLIPLYLVAALLTACIYYILPNT